MMKCRRADVLMEELTNIATGQAHFIAQNAKQKSRFSATKTATANYPFIMSVLLTWRKGRCHPEQICLWSPPSESALETSPIEVKSNVEKRISSTSSSKPWTLHSSVGDKPTSNLVGLGTLKGLSKHRLCGILVSIHL